jgi:hypothetical protein
MQTSNVFTRISNSLTIPHGKNTSRKEDATPDPWNIRLSDEWWLGGKVEIRHELNSELVESNSLTSNGDGVTYLNIDREKYEKFFKALKDSQRGIFRSNEWIYLDDYEISPDMFRYINPTEDIMLGRHEKKYFIDIIDDSSVGKSAFLYHIQTLDASWGEIPPTYTVINRIHYGAHAQSKAKNDNQSEDNNNEIYAQLNVWEDFEVYYEPIGNKVRLVNFNRAILIENIEMSFQLDSEYKNVFASHMLSGVLKGRKKDGLETLKPVAAIIPYLGQAIGTWDKIWKYIKIAKEIYSVDNANPSSTEYGQKFSYYTGSSYEAHCRTYSGERMEPIQFVSGKSKSKFLGQTGDFIRLEAEVKMFEENSNNYSAYVIIEYDVKSN